MDQVRGRQRSVRRSGGAAAVVGAAAVLLAGGGPGGGVSVAWGQTPTAFTYQGTLRSGAGPANGPHDFRFRLFAGATGVVQLGGTICLDNVQVSDGQFTVTLDFGDQFSVADRHLEMEVRADSGLDCGNLAGFTILGPRQAVTSAPAASFAFNAGTLGGQQVSFFQNAGNMTAGTLPSGRLAGTYANALTLSNAANVLAGSGAGITALNATNISQGTLADARLPLTVPRLNLSNTFAGPVNTFAGGVGINTGATLAADLHVRAAGGGPLGRLLVTPGVADSGSQVMLAENTTASLGAIVRYDGASNQLQMLGVTTGGAETAPHVMIGRDNGRMGVGVTPEARLHVGAGSAGTVGVAADAVAVLENAGNAYLQLQVPDAASAGLAFGTPTRGGSAARLQFEDASTLSLKLYLEPSLPTVSVTPSSVTLGDTTRTVSAQVTGSVAVRETTAAGGDRLTYGANSISAFAGGTISSPRIEFAAGEWTVQADQTMPVEWGEFQLSTLRSFIGAPLTIANVGGSSGQAAPVLRLRRAAAEGERLLEMTSINGSYLGFISRDGGGVAYLGFTGLHAGWGEGVKPGDLVVLSGGGVVGSLTPVEPGVPPEPVYGVAASGGANQPGVLGVVRYPLDIEKQASAENPWAVAAVGNTNVWVVDTGKDIQPGDGLVTADVPGAAQVDDPERFEVGHIFGRAAERVVWSEIAPGADGKRRVMISVLLDASVRDGRASAKLRQQVTDLEARLRLLETMLGVQAEGSR